MRFWFSGRDLMICLYIKVTEFYRFHFLGLILVYASTIRLHGQISIFFTIPSGLLFPLSHVYFALLVLSLLVIAFFILKCLDKSLPLSNVLISLIFLFLLYTEGFRLVPSFWFLSLYFVCCILWSSGVSVK